MQENKEIWYADNDGGEWRWGPNGTVEVRE